jgi:hypothetical protein
VNQDQPTLPRQANTRRTFIRRILIRLAAVPIILLVAWQLTAEIVEPHALLWFQPSSPLLEVPGIAGTTLRLHSDTRPRVGKIAGLQKGLVWVQGRRTLVQEGYGFGCPIIESEGRAYISRHATIEVRPVSPSFSQQGGRRLVKHYEIDTIDTPIRFLRRKYRTVPSLGTVSVQYDISPSGVIDVEVDFSQIHQGWQKAYLMNEQGARYFVRYADSSGLALQAPDIGIWQRTGQSVRRACFEREASDLRFCIEPEERPILYYGRERYWQRNWRGFYYLSWAGIDIEIEGPRNVYRYRIVLEAE